MFVYIYDCQGTDECDEKVCCGRCIAAVLK